MAASIVRNANAFHDPRQHAAMNNMFGAVLTDLAALRASVVGITAQLDADGGVTDTDYAATNDPAALATTA